MVDGVWPLFYNSKPSKGAVQSFKIPRYPQMSIPYLEARYIYIYAVVLEYEHWHWKAPVGVSPWVKYFRQSVSGEVGPHP